MSWYPLISVLTSARLNLSWLSYLIYRLRMKAAIDIREMIIRIGEVAK